MKNVIDKIKSKYLNTDIRKRKKIAVIGVVLILFIVTLTILIYNNAKAATLSVTKYGEADYEFDICYMDGGQCAEPPATNKADQQYFLDGNRAFCVEPGVTLTSGSTYVEQRIPFNYRVKIGTNTPHELTATDWQVKMWSLIAWKAVQLGNKKNDKNEPLLGENPHIAAQALIWEVSTNMRTEPEGFKTYEPQFNISNSFYNEYKTDNNIRSTYERLVDFVKNYDTIPDGGFSRDESSAGTITLNYDKNTKKYSSEIDGGKFFSDEISETEWRHFQGGNLDDDLDERYKIQGFNCSAPDGSNVSIEKSANKLAISTSNYLTSPTTITCVKNLAGISGGTGVLSRDQSDASNQALITANGTPTVTAYIKVKTKGTEFKIKKVSALNSNENLDAIFELKKCSNDKETEPSNCDGTAYTVISNKEPTIIAEEGRYSIEETKVPDGYYKMPFQTIDINQSHTTFTNANEPIQITFYKKDDDTKKIITGNIGFTMYKCPNNNCSASNVKDAKNIVKVTYAKGQGCYDVDNNSTNHILYPNGSAKSEVKNGDGAVCVRKVLSGQNYLIEESVIPEGYQKMQDQVIPAPKKEDELIPVDPTYSGSASEVSPDGTSSENETKYIYYNVPLKIKFYKEDSETKERINKAGFKIYDGDTLVKFDARDSHGCYKVNSNGSVSEVFTDTSINNGKVCLSYVTSGKTYKVVESTVPTGYTKMPDAQITATNKNNAATNISEKGLTDKPTIFRFIKTTNDTDNISKKYSSEIIKKIDSLTFNIYKVDSNQTLIFSNKGTTGLCSDKSCNEYHYTTKEGIKDLHTNNGQLVVKYLPKGKYVIKEASSMPGYYYDEGVTFEVTDSSNSSIAGYKDATAKIINKYTKIQFEKNDIYKYYQNPEESKVGSVIFDTAEFVLRDENGIIVKLTKESDGNYTYLLNGNNSEEKIKTKNGALSITHLLSNKKYYIEEVKAPTGFILPTNVAAPKDKPSKWVWKGHPYVVYNVGATKPSNENQSTTEIISNTPTKVIIHKKDVNTGHLISGKKVTFELYKCGDKACTESKRSKIYVTKSTLTTDKDGTTYVDSTYVYSKGNQKTDVEITTSSGVVVFRYLPATEYGYVLKETKAPAGFDLPIGLEAETKFFVSGSTVDVDAEVVKNKPSKLIIRKYSDDGETLVSGAIFKVYKVQNYNPNLSAKNQNMTELTFKTIKAGEYEYKDPKDTNMITTCSKDCDKIGSESLGDYGTFKAGELVIRYLDTDSYYVIEEVKAPEGHSLPDNPFTLVKLEESTKNVDTDITITNKYTPVTFYKYDEYNNLLDGAEYKLQRLNKSQKYEDVTVSRIDGKDGAIYNIDYNTDNKVITTKNGEATIYLLTQGQYRILETKAPEGYTLPKASINVATFFVTNDGKVKGDFVITNKKPTIPNVVLNSATSELTINIQTGQTIIRYGIIIFILLSVIVGLIILNKKIGRK